ncbi:MAG: sigma 54-interacting transcriptional regulator [Candidatus Zixiibacteriota bacterium]
MTILKTSQLLDKARQHLRNRDHKKALDVLREIDAGSLGDAQLGLYYLASGEALILAGECGHDFIEKAIAILKGLDDNFAFAHAKFLRGWQLQAIGEPLKAKEPLIESYTAFLRIDNFDSAARALNRLAMISFHMGDVDQASESLSKSITYYTKAGNDRLSNVAKGNLALVRFLSGQVQAARRNYAEIGEQLSLLDLKNRCVFLLGYAMAIALSGDVSGAKKKLAEAGKLAADFRREEASYYEYLGWIEILDKNYKAAEKALETGLKLSLEIAPESALVSQIKRLLADTYVATGKFDEAEKVGREALAVAEKINERVEIAAVYRVFAQVEAHRKCSAKACEWYRKAIDLFSMASSRYELAVTRYLAASSGLLENGERTAMLYLAREYFVSEQLDHWIKKVDEETSRVSQPAPAKSERANESDKECPTIITVNDRMKKILAMAEHVARCDMTVLLTGQTGTGKDLLAKYIHHHSGRSGKFVTVNAAAIPTSMIESELFGYARGAFTGADKEKPGLFEMADEGTFYLNEVADSTPEFQAKLLEVLETREVRRLGENKKRKVAFRLIAATNHDLDARMREGAFRPDLYHRLNEIPISLPPLDERREDIAPLVEYYLTNLGLKVGSSGSGDAIRRLVDILLKQDWPGNVRELIAQVRYLHITAQGNLERMIDLALGDGSRSEIEKLTQVLEMTGWNRSRTASILGVSEGTIRNRLRKYGLSRDDS